jgi:hypothetical protein
MESTNNADGGGMLGFWRELTDASRDCRDAVVSACRQHDVHGRQSERWSLATATVVDWAEKLVHVLVSASLRGITVSSARRLASSLRLSRPRRHGGLPPRRRGDPTWTPNTGWPPWHLLRDPAGAQTASRHRRDSSSTTLSSLCPATSHSAHRLLQATSSRGRPPLVAALVLRCPNPASAPPLSSPASLHRRRSRGGS